MYEASLLDVGQGSLISAPQQAELGGMEKSYLSTVSMQ